MPASSPIRDILEAIGLAVAQELVRLLDASGRTPLRANSPLRRQLLSGEAVKVAATGGSNSLTLYALDYLKWVDSGRKPFAKKVPLAAILQFIKDRNLKLRDKTTGRFARRRVQLKARENRPAQSVNQLAFMIQNAIYKNGIRARPVIKSALALGETLVERYLDGQLLDDMAADLERQLQLP
jgi:hypothetical protein